MKAHSAVPFVLLILGLLSCAGAHAATTRHVPADYATIQAAINASSSGDTVLVADGTYTDANDKNLDYFGKNIIVMSENGPTACIIDCQNSGRAVYLHRGEHINARFQGFTVKNGNAIDVGGGLLLNTNSSLTVSNCIFSNNTASFTDDAESGIPDGFGGAIGLLNGSSIVLTNTLILNNLAAYDYPFPADDNGGNGSLGGYGGGVFLNNGSSAVITNCVFAKNTASYSYDGLFSAGAGGYGGALAVDTASRAVVTNCTFHDNAVFFSDADGNDFSAGGALSVTGNSNQTVTNCIVWGNIAAQSAGVAVLSGNIDVTYTDEQDGMAGTGNLNNVNPLFVSTSQNNYRLQAVSPCLNVGSASALDLPPSDSDGKPRTLGSATDLGPYEYGTADTIMQLPGITTVPNATILLRAAIRRLPDGLFVPGETVTFQIDGNDVGSATTFTNGIASLTYALPSTLGVGSHTLAASFAGDGNFNASSQTATLTVNATYNTFVQIGDVSGVAGQSLLLRAVLRRYPDGQFVSGKSVVFAVDGTTLATLTTDANGLASGSATLPADLSNGSHTLTASFAGDGSYDASDTTATLTIHPNTFLQTGDLNGIVGQQVFLRAVLRRYPDGQYVTGENVAFQIDGSTVATLTTNSNGLASGYYTIPTSLASGNHTLTASFAGDGSYNASSATATLTVSYNTFVQTGNVSGTAGQQVFLRAVLRRYPDGQYVTGKSVAFAVDGTTVATFTTDANGLASGNYTLPTSLAAGSHTLTTSFTGDGGYNASSQTATLTVNP